MLSLYVKNKQGRLDAHATQSVGQTRPGGIHMKDTAFQELLMSIRQAGRYTEAQ